MFRVTTAHIVELTISANTCRDVHHDPARLVDLQPRPRLTQVNPQRSCLVLEVKGHKPASLVPGSEL